MKKRKVDDQPGGAAIWEEVVVRPPEEFELNKISDESMAALRGAATVDEFKRAYLTVQWGREAAEYILGPAE
ncbi:hypothetical protein [Maridesulfovibrio sp.]|uniref:hypothetical protein n=1 Tax=Maridesulfovibrio sp. TaxID=2795000 RepID=UPI0029CA2D70|nr:hypothetical protein [Maridesulfovibrio sp.]